METFLLYCCPEKPSLAPCVTLIPLYCATTPTTDDLGEQIEMNAQSIGQTMKSKAEIVKVQINLLEQNGPRMLQVTNEDDSLHWEGSPAEDVERLLLGRDRAYFYARIINRKLQLGQEAPGQKW